MRSNRLADTVPVRRPNVRIDHTHKGWLLRRSRCWARRRWFTVSIAAPAANGVSMGGTALGLTFGVIGFAFMIFAGLLGARKKVPVWRVGRAQTWMRGHLWLGLLSLPILLLHSGFRYGHGLTAVLMTLLIIVVASGIFGAALQHYMPRVMTREVTMETIYEEIGHVRAQLLEEAEELIAQGHGRAGESSGRRGRRCRRLRSLPRRCRCWTKPRRCAIFSTRN